MAVRNFLVEAEIDGRETNAKGGPLSKTGGMEVTIYQRKDGQIKTAARIICRAYGEKLVTEIWNDDKGQVLKFETAR